MNPKEVRARQRVLQYLGKHLDKLFAEMYGEEMGWTLLVFPFGDAKGMADYISNADRESMITVLRRMADKLERDEIMPAARGEG